MRMNEREFEITGVKLWHDLGYTGKGINIANLEHTARDEPWFDGKFNDPFDISSGYGHGGQVLDITHQVLPRAGLYILPTGMSHINGVSNGPFVEQTIPLIKEKIDLVGQSMETQAINRMRDALIEEQHDNSTWVVSAGNGTYDYFNRKGRNNVRFSVGAVHLNNEGRIVRARYSSVGDEMDFMSFSNLYVNFGDGRPRKMIGTSFSSPLLKGMIGLVKEHFIEKTGIRLNHWQSYKFVRDHCTPMGDKRYYGYGLFILPEPEKIDIPKYIDGEEIPMKDIKGIYGEDAIRRMAAKGILEGFPGGEFKPGKKLSREQMAIVLDRYDKYQEEKFKQLLKEQQ